ncbi:GNAT family N-acetyltransferase [bacterium]|jgi:ribosomal protein S18 acetylase RimI-like enzyme|nr:GNAT family N-acetyltransferase [bacterium]
MQYRIKSLSEFQNEYHLQELEEFSQNHWISSSWSKEHFTEQSGYPLKMQLSFIAQTIQEEVIGLIVSSQKQHELLKCSMDPYLYIHKLLVNPDFRGHSIGYNLLDQSIKSGETFDLYEQQLSLDEWNTDAMNFYINHFGFELGEQKPTGKYLMKRGY